MMQTTPYECTNCMAQQVGPDTQVTVEVRGGFQRGLWNLDKEGNGYWVKDDPRLEGPPELCQHCETNMDLYKVYQRREQKALRETAYAKDEAKVSQVASSRYFNLLEQSQRELVVVKAALAKAEEELVRCKGNFNQHSESDDTTKRFQLLEAE